jgi:hypothetical protein
MLNLFGLEFAANNAEFVGTLFTPGGTAHGTYRVLKSGIFLHDAKGNARAFIRKDGLGPVTTYTRNNRRYFMHCLSSRDSDWLNVPDSYYETSNAAESVARRFFPVSLGS